MRYATHVRRPRSLGAFDKSTVIPGDTQINVTAPMTAQVATAGSAYAVVAPLTKPAPGPLTVLGAGTVATLDWGKADFPSGSDPYGPDGATKPPSMSIPAGPSGAFAPFGGRIGNGAIGVDTASDTVDEAHENALLPDAPGPMEPGAPIILPGSSPGATTSGFPWWILWILGGVVVVGGTIFVLRRR